MRGDPVVDRPHARSSVETDDLAVRPGPAEIGDAAEVDDGRVRARPQVLQERVMIGNRYGRAMSSRANVVGPEIIDDIDAGAIGHQSAIDRKSTRLNSSH